MSTSEESTLVTSEMDAGQYASAQFGAGDGRSPAAIDPNNPPWGLPVAVLTWLGSVFFLFIAQALIIIPYVRYRNPGANGEALLQFSQTDPTAVLLLVLSVIPAHILTIGLVWVVVTGGGIRPFWQTLGMEWGEDIGFWSSAGLAVALVIMGLILTKLIGGEQTQLDQIVNSSLAARYTTVLMATFTAPLVEEMIYRGVVYSALQRTIGIPWAVVGVMVLFTVIHVPQYWDNIGVISTIGVLSLFLTLVRAWTGRLLPCIIIHMIFNGLSSLLIILEPYMQHDQGGEQKSAIVEFLTRAAHSFV